MPNVQPLAREDLAEFEPLFKLAEAAMGFIPRSLYTMGRRPTILRAFSALSTSVLGPGELDPPFKQLVAMMASVAAGCRYCQAHTAETAARHGINAGKVAAVFEFEASDLFTPAEKAALRLARDAAIVPNAVTPEHFAELRAHYSESQIIEIMAVISLFGWLNCWNDTIATELESPAFEFASEHLSKHGWQAAKHQSQR